MKQALMPRCDGCSSFHSWKTPKQAGLSTVFGSCRAAPPRVFDHEGTSAWPDVAVDDWCDEHEPIDPTGLGTLQAVAGLWTEAAIAGRSVNWRGKGGEPLPPTPDPAWQRVAKFWPDPADPSALEVWTHGEEAWAVGFLQGRPIAVLIADDDQDADDAEGTAP